MFSWIDRTPLFWIFCFRSGGRIPSCYETRTVFSAQQVLSKNVTTNNTQFIAPKLWPERITNDFQDAPAKFPHQFLFLEVSSKDPGVQEEMVFFRIDFQKQIISVDAKNLFLTGQICVHPDFKAWFSPLI